jgi:3-dehydrosphinganine reductase
MDSFVGVAVGGAVVAITMIIAIVNALRVRKSVHDNAVIVITGGSAGIGLAYAKSVATNHSPKKIVILARNPQVLQSAQNEILSARSCPTTQIDVMVCDVSNEKECAVVSRKLGDVDVLVNCAGVSYPSELENLKVSEIDTMINTNLLGSIYLTRNLVSGMKDREKGTIVFVASQAAQAGLYGYTVYSATKFALRGLAEALHMEVKPYGMKVCVAYPPDTNTEAYTRENKMKPEATRLMSESGLMEPEAVANIMRKGVESGNFSIWCNFDGFMLSQLTAGFVPSNGLWQTIYQLSLVSLFRAVAVGYRMYFDSIAKKCIAKNTLKKA